MNLYDALVLGIVEGVTEFLPVSSTAHLMFASSLLGLAQSDFVKSFEIAIQLGAILSVLVLYGRALVKPAMFGKVLAAFLPTAVVGLVLYPFIRAHLVGNIPVALGALFLGGIALIAFERFAGRKKESSAQQDMPSLSYAQALLIGCAQSVAVIPGVSRSAATVLGGMMLGMPRYAAVEFSFLLAIPTMAAATSLDLYKNYASFSSADMLALGVGFAASFITALAATTWLLRFVRTRDFTAFGVYRIVAAAVFFFVLL